MLFYQQHIPSKTSVHAFCETNTRKQEDHHSQGDMTALCDFIYNLKTKKQRNTNLL